MPSMFSRPGSSTFVPDGVPADAALARTTHLGIGAHADDLEIMAIHGILACFERSDRWFAGAVVTDGAGSPPADAALDSAAPRETRRHEQERAAALGKYGAQVFFDYSSHEVKELARAAVVDDLVTLLRATRPEVVYTHAPSDAHDTHVAVALRVVSACRLLPAEERPMRVLGCEVWRDLDWLLEDDKIALPTDEHLELQQALLECFPSQLAAKRYADAALGRRAAHAAFSDARGADRHRGLVWAMDLGPLIVGTVEPRDLVVGQLRRLEDDVVARLARLSG